MTNKPYKTLNGSQETHLADFSKIDNSDLVMSVFLN
jgi:hypothetical protein